MSRTDFFSAEAAALRLSVGDLVMSMDPAASAPDGQLVHVEARAGVEHRAPGAHRDHAQGVAAAQGGEGGALQRVDGDVGLGLRAVAHLLAVVEHGGVVLLALADDDDAVHRHGGQDDPHGLGGGAVGALLVAPAHPAGGGQGGGLGDPDQFHGQVAVGGLGLSAHDGHPIPTTMRAALRRRALRSPAVDRGGR